MTVLVSDSFNRVDNSTTLGSTDSYAGGTSQAWQVVSGGTYGISSNQAYSAITVNDKPAYVETGASDVKVSVDVISSSGIYVTGLTFRFQDVNNFFRVYATTGFIKIDRRLNGSYTTILNQSLTGMSYPYTLTIEGNGSTINAYANGVLKATVTDSNFTTATKHGLYLSNTAQRLDNFKVEDLGTGGGTDATINAVTATSNADTIAPVVTTQQQVSVSAVIADATAAAANNPVLSLDANISGVNGSSSADALTPQVGSFTNISVNAVIVNATADAFSPSVDAIRNISIDGTIADMTAEATVPAVGLSSSVQITAVITSATADGLAPSVATTQGTRIDSVVAELTVDALSPTIQTDAIISAFIADVLATGMAPIINKDAIPEYNEVIQIVLNITRKQTAALDITQRKQSELKL